MPGALGLQNAWPCASGPLMLPPCSSPAIKKCVHIGFLPATVSTQTQITCYNVQTSIEKLRSMPPKSAPPNTERHMKGANQTSQQSKQDKNKRKRNKTNKKANVQTQKHSQGLVQGNVSPQETSHWKWYLGWLTKEVTGVKWTEHGWAADRQVP